jgi:hypothetical protein
MKVTYYVSVFYEDKILYPDYKIYRHFFIRITQVRGGGGVVQNIL